MKSTQCSKCGSADTQSFGIANKMGTSAGQVVGLGVGADGDLGVARGFSNHQTGVGKLTEPPKDFSWTDEIALVGFSIAAFLLVMVGAAFAGYLILGLVAALIAGPAVAWFGWHRFVSPRVSKNKAAYKAALLKWEHSWICLRCGNTYYVR